MQYTFEKHRGSLFWEGRFNHSYWVKRDALILENCDYPLCYNCLQFVGGFAWFRKGDFARKVVGVWLRDMQDERISTDSNNTLGKPNLPGFQENRHDQSAITNIYRANKWWYAPEKDTNRVMFSTIKFMSWKG